MKQKQQPKTLIVDDSTTALQMMGYMLNKCGLADITEAKDGLHALKRFERELLIGTRYSLVFLDIVMPLLDGQETLKLMRAMEADAGVKAEDRAVIIMATSLSSTDDIMKAVFDGECSDYLVKPFGADDVRGMLLKHQIDPQ
jgi:two-component system chemotaxis response regulator CheY